MAKWLLYAAVLGGYAWHAVQPVISELALRTL